MMNYEEPKMEICQDELIMDGVSAEIEPATATVAAAGITTLGGITIAVINKGCW
jgi:hypothetical protein